MRYPTLPLALLNTLLATAQYGAFDAHLVENVKTMTTQVVVDNGTSPYDQAMLAAMKGHWKATPTYGTITAEELAQQGIQPNTLYVLKTWKEDAEKHGAHYLALAIGKGKKALPVEMKDNAFTNLPAEQAIANLMVDVARMSAAGQEALAVLYLKNLQSYLKTVQSGKVTDKTTLERLYLERFRSLRDGTELWLAPEHLDKSLPDLNAVKASYSKGQVQLMAMPQIMSAITAGKQGVAVADVVMTGEYKTKWCFKRVFNAASGELMYLGDDAALFGKKEGFIAEDLLKVDRAR
jgi:DUF971 family protein